MTARPAKMGYVRPAHARAAVVSKDGAAVVSKDGSAVVAEIVTVDEDGDCRVAPLDRKAALRVLLALTTIIVETDS